MVWLRSSRSDPKFVNIPSMDCRRFRQIRQETEERDTYPPVHLHLLRLLLLHGHHRRFFLDHGYSHVSSLIRQSMTISDIPCRDVGGFTLPSSRTSNNTNSPPSSSLITPIFTHLFRAFAIIDSSTAPPTLEIKASAVHFSEKHLQSPQITQNRTRNAPFSSKSPITAASSGVTSASMLRSCNWSSNVIVPS